MTERPAFRSDIEGLRGVAILLVVGFHAGIAWLAGGFVGVDVFLVLSGYFITDILYRELLDEGRVDVVGFYGRREIRLLPSLVLVLLATLVLVMWLYAPIDRPSIARGARAVALYTSNVEFARNSVDYFSSGENPLLHTWSLAVELQFYMVWPLLFLLVAWRARNDTNMDGADDGIRRRVVLGMVLLGVVSFGLSVWLTRTAQPWAFFGMPTRIWEFALGGLLAVTMGTQTDAKTWPATMLSVIGLAAIGFAVATYDRVTPYPGVAAVLPALGAIALIVGGARAPESWPSRMLSAPWLRWFGRMSFAWYLWHWPLIGLGGVLSWNIGVPGRLAWSGVALVLAVLTHRCIESPVRAGRIQLSRNTLAFAGLATSLMMALIATLALARAEQQVRTPAQKTFAAAREDRMRHDCWATTVETPTGPCEFGDKTSTTTLVLLGDSHAEHWLGGLDRVGKERGWKIVAFVKGGCPVPEMPELTHPRMKRYYRECTRYREASVQKIIAMRPQGAILSSWDHYMPLDGSKSDWQVTPEAWRDGLRRTYSRLTAAGIPTVAIRGTPRTWFDVPQCLSRRAAKLPLSFDCQYDRATALSPISRRAQDEAARGLPVKFVDMNDQVCPPEWRRCPVTRNGVVVFTDDNHLTRSFSASTAPVLGARLQAALLDGVR
ncbi:MAG TPA: acyltransferase family protein [Gemmatimonadaceae bacterium]|nr:acyltransferase family protein [Gemmatimonadaceae bacterium]